MNASERRSQILKILNSASSPISASALASRFNVSRQIIVGDIALLRASGSEINATPRGYTLFNEDKLFTRRIAVCHDAESLKEELYIFVDHGCHVVNVIVDHPIYGQLTGELMLSSRYDVDRFAERCRESEALPLSCLTEGIHLHTVTFTDEDMFRRVVEELDRKGFLLKTN